MTDKLSGARKAIFETSMGRRTFMGRFGAAAGTGVALCAFPGIAALGSQTASAAEAAGGTQAPARAAQPVISVFMDYPYVDVTGTAEPYIPPKTVGAQSELPPHEDFGKYHMYV